MRFVLTLISAAPDHRLAGVAAAVSSALGTVEGPVWLAAGAACDVFFDAADPAMIERRVRAIVGEAAIDLLLQPPSSRRKRLLVADFESTIIENEMLDELGSIIGIGPAIAEITWRAMNGEIDFANALIARVALLGGTETRVLAEAAARIRLCPGAESLVATARRAGMATALVTGGFTFFAEPVAARLGFDRVVANRLEIAEDRLTGKVLPPIVTGETKKATLVALADELRLPPEAVLAVGDGANDLPMLNAAGLGIAYHAKPAVAAAARFRLDHADLTGLLYAQGYRREEILG
ncbi:MAG: phosphoserine phosphatase SerB [Alphaproteobacteria bacterium]|nr:phosphoserine phosphatase SerB [Alphaproteobacteria bacterium]